MPQDDPDDGWSDDDSGTGWEDEPTSEDWDDQSGRRGSPGAGGGPGGPPGGDDWRDDEWDDPSTLEESEQLQLVELFTRGIEGVASVTGLVLVALLSVMGLISTVVTESIFATWIEFTRDALTDPEMQEQLQNSGLTQEEALEILDGVGPFPFAFDLPAWVLVLGILVPPFIAEAIRIVGVRAFAADELDGIPGELTSRRILTATILGWFGGTLLQIGLVIGTVLLVIPGVLLAIVTVFFRQEIAVADKGLIEALRGTYSLSKGHWLELFGLLVVLAVITFGTGLVIGFVIPQTSIVGGLVNAVVSGVSIVFSMAVVTAAYVQLGGGHADEPSTQF